MEEKKYRCTYITCAKSKQAVSPLGMQRRNSLLPVMMLQESFMGTQAGCEGWGEALQRGKKAAGLAERSTEWRNARPIGEGTAPM